MNRTLFHFLTDALAALAMLGMIATGIILRFTLPPGTNRSLTLWDLTRHQWGDLHFWLALAVLGVVVIHLVLHWTWIVSVIRRWIVGPAPGAPSARARALAAMATVIVLTLSLTGFWKWSMASIRPVESAQRTDDAERADGHRLRGSMTLAEAAAALGCSTQDIRARLSLSDHTRDTDRLGQIARQMNIEMRELRHRLEAKATDVAP